ncbi:SAM-dependent methyltransferase [Candidatus Chlamydia corallus]|uniref:SAM-dependent methyltransferase n=1 Tax=Candidatus Chlamydia corallus TaxID=2038470 RepID=UPI000C2FD77E|nr:SAM-dependent methyltransferase [Candidatus Chlamydia corallus]
MSYFNCRKNSVILKSLGLLAQFSLRLIYRVLFSFREGIYLFSSLYLKYPKLFFYDIGKYVYSLRHCPYAKLSCLPEASLLKEGNVYGETPWSVLAKVSQAFDITSRDVLYDLGCGLGKVCFWFSHVVRCQVIGIDNQPNFIHFSSNMHRRLSSGLALFHIEDFKNVTLSRASYVYFYGSSFSRRLLNETILKLSEMAPGSVVISISFPLDSFSKGREFFFTEKSCSVRFPWGKTIAYKNIRKDS